MFINIREKDSSLNKGCLFYIVDSIYNPYIATTAT